jgi:hypothetical protein
MLPGTILDVTTLLACKKFRSRGNKEGALQAMRALEADGLGKLIEKSSHRGASSLYTFHKTPIPSSNVEEFAKALSKYGISLSDYQRSLLDKAPRKRQREEVEDDQ